jgi:hypothetical protein
MANAITDSFKIICNGTTKDSLTDYGWAVENRFDCIGDPVKQSSLVSVPFGKTYDLADALNDGEPYFISRSIDIRCGVKIANENWRDYISNLRNEYEGRDVSIRFSDDSWLWSGKAFIRNVKSDRESCNFVFHIDADAYKRGNNTRTQGEGPLTFPLLEGTSAVEVKTGANTNGALSWTTAAAPPPFELTPNMPWTEVPDLIAGLATNVEYTGSGTFEYRYKARSL